MKKRLNQVSVIILIILALTFIAPLQVWAALAGSTEISSKGAVVIDFDTGLQLYGHNEKTQRVPASTLKLLAAYVIYDAVKAGEISFDTKAVISKKVSEASRDREYSNVPLTEGSSYKISQLLEVVLVCSACAATVALA